MGNTNYYSDPDFIWSYDQLQKEFKEAEIVFNVKDIKFPLYTSGMKIVDSNGKRVKIAAANWSGGHAARHCVGGLDRQ